MKLPTKTLTFTDMSKVVALFDKGIHEQIYEELSMSDVSWGWDKQSTFISRDTFIETIEDMFDGHDLDEGGYAALNDALKAGIAKVKKSVGKKTLIMIEA